jgi:hypothetical protein
MVYDDLKWHYKKEWPQELPKKLAATHTGMFLTWAIDNDLLCDEHYRKSKRMIQAVQDGKMTGAEFYMDVLGGKLVKEDFNQKGNLFAAAYFDGQYIDDYMYVLDDDFFDSIYEVKDTWRNFEKLEPVLDKRFREWQKNPKPKQQPKTSTKKKKRKPKK